MILSLITWGNLKSFGNLFEACRRLTDRFPASDLHPRGTYLRLQVKKSAPEPFNSPSREILRKAISAAQTLSRSSSSGFKALAQKKIFRMNETFGRALRKLLYHLQKNGKEKPKIAAETEKRIDDKRVDAVIKYSKI